MIAKTRSEAVKLNRVVKEVVARYSMIKQLVLATNVLDMHGVPRVALYNKRFSKRRVVINTRLPPHTINVLLIYNVLYSTCL
jgi:hypothetical protein